MGASVATVATGATIATGATKGGGDLGNKLIPKSNNIDKPMNNNSYITFFKFMLNIIFPPAFQNL